MPRRQVDTATFAVLLEQEFDKKGWGGLSTRKLLAKLRAGGEFPWSEATLRRDLKSDQLPTLDRVGDYARVLTIRPDRLKPPTGAAFPSVVVPHNGRRWAVCPNKMCTSATWERGMFVEYAWFLAERDDRYCKKCGTALRDTCPTDSPDLSTPFAGSEATLDKTDEHRTESGFGRITGRVRYTGTRRQMLSSLRLYKKLAKAGRDRASYVYLPPGS